MSTYRIGGIEDAKLTDSGGSDYDIPFANLAGLTPEFETLTFEGDGTSVEDYYALRVTGSFACDKYSEALLEQLYGKTAITSGLPAGTAKRYYMGTTEDIEPVQHQLTVDYHAIDDSDESEKTVRVVVFKIRSRPYVPPEGGTAAKLAPHTFEFSSELTTTDIEAAALPSVPAGGAHYSIDVLS